MFQKFMKEVTLQQNKKFRRTSRPRFITFNLKNHSFEKFESSEAA